MCNFILGFFAGCAFMIYIAATIQCTNSIKCGIIFKMENLSSDRMMAVRVFEGELERMKSITDGQYDAIQKIVRQYLQERINEMTAKGYVR